MHCRSMPKVPLGHLFRFSPESVELGTGLLQAPFFVAFPFLQELKNMQAGLHLHPSTTFLCHELPLKIMLPHRENHIHRFPRGQEQLEVDGKQT